LKRGSLCLFAAGLLLALGGLGTLETFGAPAPKGEPANLHPRPAVVRAARIPLFVNNPSQRRAGRLIYRGGLVLSSTNRDFGGWSDLAVSADGGEILALSDEGHWLRAKLTYDGNGDLAGVGDAEIAQVLDMNGRPVHGNENDSEGLTLERPNDLYGPVVISFEIDVRLWRYDFSKGWDALPSEVPLGDWQKALNWNKQIEAITLWRPDTLLAFGEEKLNEGDDLLAAMEAYPNRGGKPMTRKLSVVPHGDFDITGAANAPDGGIYLLERRFSLLGGVGMEIRHIPPSEIHEGARLNGEVLVNLSFQDANIDNMEGLAVRRGPHGETFLYVISDDNYWRLQRTLLLMFEVRN
jgi:hypothetical protein